MKAFSPQQAKDWAEGLCSRAEYSSGEIRERLIRKGILPLEADKIVDYLIKNRFIDDERFARAFVREKNEYARWGKRKVAQALRLKRIDRCTIDDALAEIDSERYMAGLTALLAAKIRSLGLDPASLDYATRIKLLRFAAARGFEPAVASAALSKLAF